MTSAAVLAHQGGWDEAVLVILPLVVLGGLLAAARRRAQADAEREGLHSVDDHQAGTDPGTTTPPPAS